MVQEPGDNGILFSSDMYGGFSASSTQGDGSVSGTEFHFPEDPLSVSKRIKLSQHQAAENVVSREKKSPLGLTLRKTPSLLNLLEVKLSRGGGGGGGGSRRNKRRSFTDPTINAHHVISNTSTNPSKIDDFVSQPMSEKLKASNFPATVLRIGCWERISRHEGDLIAKCYYAKRKLVWEVLEGALKSKIEMQWSDIVAIRAVIQDNEPGILEIELNQPPLFFTETNPQPRKHTLWQQASDFTCGQAPIYRRHYVSFPPGMLDRHYEKLLQCDPKLLMLSRKPFPSQESPYFHSNTFNFSEIPFEFNGFTEFPPKLPYPTIQTCPSSLVHSQRVQTTFKPTAGLPLGRIDSDSPMSVMDFPRTHSKSCNYVYGDHRMNDWGGQGANDTMDISTKTDHIHVPSSFTTNVLANPGFFDQTYQVPQEIGGLGPDSRVIDVIERHLLGDPNVVCSDEKATLARMRSMSLLEHEELNVKCEKMTYDDNAAIFKAAAGIDCTELPWPEPMCWLPNQDSRVNMMIHPPENNSVCPFVLSEQMLENVADLESSHQVHHWT